MYLRFIQYGENPETRGLQFQLRVLSDFLKFLFNLYKRDDAIDDFGWKHGTLFVRYFNLILLIK